MPYVIEGDNVYYQDERIKQHVGVVNKTDIGVRQDEETVADISYQFDLELGEYVEVSRITRNEPLPPDPETDKQKIAKLEQQLSQTNADLAALMEAVYLAP